MEFGIKDFFTNWNVLALLVIFEMASELPG